MTGNDPCKCCDCWYRATLCDCEPMGPQSFDEVYMSCAYVDDCANHPDGDCANPIVFKDDVELLCWEVNTTHQQVDQCPTVPQPPPVQLCYPSPPKATFDNCLICCNVQCCGPCHMCVGEVPDGFTACGVPCCYSSSAQMVVNFMKGGWTCVFPEICCLSGIEDDCHSSCSPSSGSTTYASFQSVFGQCNCCEPIICPAACPDDPPNCAFDFPCTSFWAVSGDPCLGACAHIMFGQGGPQWRLTTPGFCGGGCGNDANCCDCTCMSDKCPCAAVQCTPNCCLDNNRVITQNCCDYTSVCMQEHCPSFHCCACEPCGPDPTCPPGGPGDCCGAADCGNCGNVTTTVTATITGNQCCCDCDFDPCLCVPWDNQNPPPDSCVDPECPTQPCGGSPFAIAACCLPEISQGIVAAVQDPGGDYWVVPGDQSGLYREDLVLEIQGGTPNDGTYVLEQDSLLVGPDTRVFSPVPLVAAPGGNTFIIAGTCVNTHEAGCNQHAPGGFQGANFLCGEPGVDCPGGDYQCFFDPALCDQACASSCIVVDVEDLIIETPAMIFPQTVLGPCTFRLVLHRLPGVCTWHEFGVGCDDAGEFTICGHVTHQGETCEPPPANAPNVTSVGGILSCEVEPGDDVWRMSILFNWTCNQNVNGSVNPFWVIPGILGDPCPPEGVYTFGGFLTPPGAFDVVAGTVRVRYAPELE